MPRISDDDDEAKESKWEGKEMDKGDAKGGADDGDDEWVLPGMGQAEDDTLLVRAAKFVSSPEFTRAMEHFVQCNAPLWEDGSDVRDTGEGSSHESLAAWRSIHEVRDGNFTSFYCHICLF